MTAMPGAAGRWPQPGSRRHGHLWSLPDGTGLHAPPGRLVIEEGTGRVCCHLCGWWFTSLGIHVRAHGYTAGTYRQAMGLPRGSALTAAGPARRRGRAADSRAAAPADTRSARRRAGPAGRSDPPPRAEDRPATAEDRPGERASVLRAVRSEGWTIMLTPAAGACGGDWARWLWHQTRRDDRPVPPAAGR